MARKKTTPEEEMNQNPATEVDPMQEAGSLETIQQPNGPASCMGSTSVAGF